MADLSVQSTTALANQRDPSQHVWELYRGLMRSKAEWDVWTYSTPEERQDDSDQGDALSNAHTEALNKLLLTPARNISDLELKLRVFRDEDLSDGWYMAGPIVTLLAEDARRIALAS